MVEQDTVGETGQVDGVEGADRGASGAGVGGEDLEDAASDGLVPIVGLEVQDGGAADGHGSGDRELVIARGVVAGAVGAPDLDLEGARVDRVVAEDGEDIRGVAGGDSAAGLGQVAADGAGALEEGRPGDVEVLTEGIALVVVEAAVDGDDRGAVGAVIAIVDGAGDERQDGIIVGLDVPVDDASQDDRGLGVGGDVAIEDAGAQALAIRSVDGDGGRVGREDVGVDHAAGLDGDGGRIVGIDAIRRGQRAGDGDGSGVVEVDLGAVELDGAAGLHVERGGIANVHTVGVRIGIQALGGDLGQGRAGLDVERARGADDGSIDVEGLAEVEVAVVEGPIKGDVAEQLRSALADIEVLVVVVAGDLEDAEAVLVEARRVRGEGGRGRAEERQLAAVDDGGVEAAIDLGDGGQAGAVLDDAVDGARVAVDHEVAGGGIGAVDIDRQGVIAPVGPEIVDGERGVCGDRDRRGGVSSAEGVHPDIAAGRVGAGLVVDGAADAGLAGAGDVNIVDERQACAVVEDERGSAADVGLAGGAGEGAAVGDADGTTLDDQVAGEEVGGVDEQLAGAVLQDVGDAGEDAAVLDGLSLAVVAEDGAALGGAAVEAVDGAVDGQLGAEVGADHRAVGGPEEALAVSDDRDVAILDVLSGDAAEGAEARALGTIGEELALAIEVAVADALEDQAGLIDGAVAETEGLAPGGRHVLGEMLADGQDAGLDGEAADRVEGAGGVELGVDVGSDLTVADVDGAAGAERQVAADVEPAAVLGEEAFRAGEAERDVGLADDRALERGAVAALAVIEGGGDTQDVATGDALVDVVEGAGERLGVVRGEGAQGEGTVEARASAGDLDVALEDGGLAGDVGAEVIAVGIHVDTVAGLPDGEIGGGVAGIEVEGAVLVVTLLVIEEALGVEALAIRTSLELAADKGSVIVGPVVVLIAVPGEGTGGTSIDSGVDEITLAGVGVVEGRVQRPAVSQVAVLATIPVIANRVESIVETRLAVVPARLIEVIGLGGGGGGTDERGSSEEGLGEAHGGDMGVNKVGSGGVFQ